MNLDHLDDPLGFVPDERFRAAAQRDGRRRRTRRRLALATGSVLTTMAVMVASLAGYGLWRTSQIDRVDVEFAAPPVSLDEPFNILLIGSDSRAGTSDDVNVPGARSDTMIVVRVLPAERRLLLLSLPRDLVVTPLEGGEPERLNTAFLEGGPDRLVQTVETRLGIPLSAYAEIGFDGMVELVDQAGGVPLAVYSPVRDEQTGLELEASSCSVLDGEQALALLRSRHLEELGFNGVWREDPTSDLGRMARQRAVIAAILPRLSKVADSLGGIEAALDVAARDVTIDDRLDTARLVELGRWLAAGPSPSAESVPLSVTDARIGEAQVLVLWRGADAAIAAMGGTPPSFDELQAAKQASAGSTGFSPATGREGSVPFGPCP